MDWHVGHTADQCIQEGRVEPLIIVGIYNAGKQRLGEYTPTRMPRLGGGRANRYANFLLEEVRPFREHRISSAAWRGKHWDWRVFARWSGFTLSGSAAAANLRQNCRLIAIRLVERTCDRGIRRRCAGPTPSPHLAGYRHTRRSAHRGRCRALSRCAHSGRVGSPIRICTTNASKAPSTTKPPGRSASARSCNSSFPRR